MDWPTGVKEAKKQPEEECNKHGCMNNASDLMQKMAACHTKMVFVMVWKQEHKKQSKLYKNIMPLQNSLRRYPR